MALGVSEEHLELAASVRGWAERHGGPDVAADSYPGVLRAGLAAQGLLGLHLPEEHGGQGYGLGEQAVALEELGRALVPGGFLPTVLASALLARAGDPAGNTDTAKLLAGLADGSRTGAVALATGLTGTVSDDVLTLDGESAPVLGGDLADLLVLPVQTGEDELWAVVDAADLIVTGLDSLDQTRPLATVRASGAPGARRADPARPDPDPGHVADRRAVRGRSVRHRRLGGADGGGLRPDPAPVRPADRPVPGGQAPVRPDAHRGRAGCRGQLGRGGRVRRPATSSRDTAAGSR